ncbi:putative inactive leucine-rich repeat receptor kinase XIAO [Cinnamomum micranthum f. kanehirae]|uniref:Putative inactive leucine-rich repeat receptor kinase XIAO n=1 Tax=Cinnamomum micranthum f. kanehirae TaxID=337451 RepID=A0A443Q5C8_9MAGN|nr:putative inactive leucine-rich repeat receptor kinase XIAO [Cinnamomum micranthum f. kanehirae]
MAKSIKDLKKENNFLKSKCEKSDVSLIELVEEPSVNDASIRHPSIERSPASGGPHLHPSRLLPQLLGLLLRPLRQLLRPAIQLRHPLRPQRLGTRPSHRTRPRLGRLLWPLSVSPGRLPFLGTLDVADNRFSGPLPPAISNLTRLSRLSLSRNSFSGQIPPDFSSLSDLQHLYLDNNLLSGQIPPALGSGLQSLVRLELQSNRLSGEFPDLSGLKNLAFVDASDNLLSGPVVLRRFPPSIVQISMRDNQLEGELSEGISDLPLLQVVDLSHNRLSGEAPAAVFEHPSLEQVTLSYNGLSSVGVPAGGGRGSGLIALDLGGIIGWRGAGACIYGADAEAVGPVAGEQPADGDDSGAVRVEGGGGGGGAVREADSVGELSVWADSWAVYGDETGLCNGEFGG